MRRGAHHFGTTIEVDVRVDARVRPAVRGLPQTMDGPGTPDEPAEAEIIHVMAGAFDIVGLLSDHQLADLERQAIERASERACERRSYEG